MTESENVNANIEVSVIVPVYNEERNLPQICEKLRLLTSTRPNWEVILVDDASTDASCEVLEGCAPPNSRVLKHTKNRGKAAALRTGIDAAVGEVIVFQDADLEYSPQELPGVVEPVLSGVTVASFGDRFHDGRPHGMRVRNYVANRFLSALTGLLYATHVRDMETCYKAFNAEFLRSLHLEAERFGIEPEITSRTLQRHVKILWTPISYTGRTVEEGKKIGFSDGIEAISTLARCRLTRYSAKASRSGESRG